MKKLVLYSILSVFSLILIQACGPSQKEKQAQETARQNQIAQARQDSIAKAQAEAAAKKREAEMENQKQDTTAKETVQKPKTAPKPAIQYSAKGDYTLQVGSWRSKNVADNHLSIWKKRGYTHAYIVKFGNEDSGDIWYRVRLGVVQTKEMANQLKQEVQDKYQRNSWISYIGNEKSTSSK